MRAKGVYLAEVLGDAKDKICSVFAIFDESTRARVSTPRERNDYCSYIAATSKMPQRLK